jgi:AAHS family 4-hydroxybenzoate transporter-like MFS transporter
MVVLMFTGITTGSGLPGAIQAGLIPEYGWRVMFLIGGVVPVLVAICLYFTLPESVKYLSLHPGRSQQLLATLRRMRPDVAFAGDVKFAGAAEVPASGSGLKQIFSGGLAWITPLLWACFATTLMANFFLVSWMPLIFEIHGLTPQQAGLATSLYHYGGTLGGVLVSLLLGRFGFAVIAGMYLLAIPAIAAIGLPGTSYVAMAAITSLAGFFVLGSQFGNNAAVGLIYPTAFRSRGVGWAFAVGRFGSIVGPLLGASLIAMQLPLQTLFLIAALPMVIGVVAAGLVARLCYTRFRGLQLDDAPAARL